MMQSDTPIEGGRREGSRAGTQAAPGAKTQLLMAADGCESKGAGAGGKLANSKLACQCPG